MGNAEIFFYINWLYFQLHVSNRFDGSENLLCYEMVIMSSSTVLVRTLAASIHKFRNRIKTLGRTPLDE